MDCRDDCRAPLIPFREAGGSALLFKKSPDVLFNLRTFSIEVRITACDYVSLFLDTDYRVSSLLRGCLTASEIRNSKLCLPFQDKRWCYTIYEPQ